MYLCHIWNALRNHSVLSRWIHQFMACTLVSGLLSGYRKLQWLGHRKDDIHSWSKGPKRQLAGWWGEQPYSFWPKGWTETCHDRKASERETCCCLVAVVAIVVVVVVVVVVFLSLLLIRIYIIYIIIILLLLLFNVMLLLLLLYFIVNHVEVRTCGISYPEFVKERIH